MQLSATWNYPTSIRFGPGRIAELAATVREAGIKRPLFVTDANLVALPMTQSALATLGGDGVALFSDVKSNPVESNIAAGVAAFRQGAHDGVVAFGGGSALDAGKLIAFAAGQTRPIWDFEDVGDNWRRADATRIAPVIAVPTTAGTGSEVGRAGVVTDERMRTKKVIFHPAMMPKAAICDPVLTVAMPPPITAGTGMDALAHCLEAYCGAFYHPLADGIAVEGTRLVKQSLARAVAAGDDIEARANMMAAAAMGATAFQKALGAIHALSHPVGALYDTHHELTNAEFMPDVLVFNRKAIENRIRRLAAYLGLKSSFGAFLEWLLELRAAVGVPHTLAGLNVGDEQLDLIVAMAVEDPTAPGNPVPLDEGAARSIFRNALEGRL